MTDEERKKLKQLILEKCDLVQADIQNLKDITRPIAPENSIGRLTRMDAINTKGVNEAALEKAEFSLVKLKTALKNIDQPGFGVCAVCEEPIPMARMVLLPESTRCVSCVEE